MSSAPAIKSAVSRLRVLLGRVDQDAKVKDIVSAQDEVLARYQPIFSSENIPDLSEDVVKVFLRFKNNKHWTGLQRMGPAICSDMPRLRKALAILLDEDRPIEKRLDTLLPRKGKSFVFKLGKAVLTGILHVAHPNKYGVYNGTSESRMKLLEVWPSFDRGEPFGKRYLAVNEVLCQLATELGVDLWTLDALWYLAKRRDNDNGDNK